MPASLPICHVSGEHEDGDGGDGEANDDDELGKIRLIDVVGVLVVDKEVDVEEEDEDADDRRHDHKGEIEIPHYGPIWDRIRRDLGI